MKKQLLEKLIGLLLSMLTPEMMRIFADQILDWVENEVMESDNKIDDAAVLPLCNMIRSTFDIPDED